MTKNTSAQETRHGRRAGLFVLLAALIITGPCLAQGPANSAQDENTAQDTHRVPVVVASPVQRTFERRMVTQGNVEAKYTALVAPRFEGSIIEQIFVDEGDTVTAGQTRLFATDAVKLEQNKVIQEHALAVARCVHLQAQAGLDKAQAELDKAELDFNRFQRLLEQGATTQDLFEQQQSRYKQTAVEYKLTQAKVDLAAEQVRQAEATLAIAQKDLADTVVLAPISGKISHRMVEPGEMGNPGQPVVRIVDPATLEVSAFLPAAVYPQVTPERTAMKVSVSNMDLGPRPVSYKAPTINPKLRTFEVKTILKDLSDAVAPGAMAEVTVVLESHDGIGVPTEAIQQRGGRSVVFVVDHDKARQVPVTTGLESDGWTEVTTGDLKPQTPVIRMGQSMVQDGTPVTVHEEGR